MTSQKQLIIFSAVLCIIGHSLAAGLILAITPRALQGNEQTAGRALQATDSKVCLTSLDMSNADTLITQGNVLSLVNASLKGKTYRVVVLASGTTVGKCQTDKVYPKQLKFKKSESRHFSDRFGLQLLSADGKIYRAVTSQFGSVLIAFKRWGKGGKLDPKDFLGDATFNMEAASKKFGLIKGVAENKKTYAFLVLLD